MHSLELRIQAGTKSDKDLKVMVQEKTFEYLMSSNAPEIRVSAYLDRDWPEVEAQYEELFIDEECPYSSTVLQVIPGSKTRKGITLPGAMKEGEQLTILVGRVKQDPIDEE